MGTLFLFKTGRQNLHNWKCGWTEIFW